MFKEVTIKATAPAVANLLWKLEQSTGLTYYCRNGVIISASSQDPIPADAIAAYRWQDENHVWHPEWNRALWETYLT